MKFFICFLLNLALLGRECQITKMISCICISGVLGVEGIHPSLNSILQRSPNYGPQPNNRPWPICNWVTLSGMPVSVHLHPHLHKWLARTHVCACPSCKTILSSPPLTRTPGHQPAKVAERCNPVYSGALLKRSLREFLLQGLETFSLLLNSVKIKNLKERNAMPEVIFHLGF